MPSMTALNMTFVESPKPGEVSACAKCHSYCAKMSRVARTLLNCPECPDAGELSSNTDDEKVCKRQRVKNHDRILERCDNSHSRIQRVAEKEVAFGDG